MYDITIILKYFLILVIRVVKSWCFSLSEINVWFTSVLSVYGKNYFNSQLACVNTAHLQGKEWGHCIRWIQINMISDIIIQVFICTSWKLKVLCHNAQYWGVFGKLIKDIISYEILNLVWLSGFGKVLGI